MKNIFLIPILFISLLSFAQEVEGISIDLKDNSEKEVYRMVNKMPEYPGGEIEMYKFIAANLHYPQTAVIDNIEGVVYVEFVITDEGEVSSIRINRGLRKDLDEAVIEVISKMPKWKPGMQDEKKVSVKYLIPVRFSLQ